jgi:hypothetical protein
MITPNSGIASFLAPDRSKLTVPLDAIVSNENNLAYGTIIKVYTGPDGIITALTDYGVDELRDMIAAARCSPSQWDQFLDDFVNDPGIIARVKAQTPR